MFDLIQIPKTDPDLKKRMETHYSKPKGFVGRSICYKIMYLGEYYGNIVAGSATKHLPNRNQFWVNFDLNCINIS